MAATAIMPVSVVTDLGGRVIVDLGAPKLDLQKLENPQASIRQCATKFGAAYVRRIFEKLEEKGRINRAFDTAVPTNIDMCEYEQEKRGKGSVWEEINLSDNLIGDEGAAWLQRGLAGNPNLRKLLLARAGLGPDGFKSMGKLLGETPGLETLVLSNNMADSEGLAGDFCDGLALNRSVQSLYLAGCRLGDQGIAPLCQGPLRSHPTLQHLSLEYNRLSSASALSLSAMLRSNQVLRYLDLCGNSLGPEGAEALAKGLQENSKLKGNIQQLGMAQNAIKLHGAMALVKFFLSASGQNLEYLDIRHNRIGHADMQKLKADTDLERLKDEMSDGWLYLFNDCQRQLFVNGSF